MSYEKVKNKGLYDSYGTQLKVFYSADYLLGTVLSIKSKMFCCRFINFPNNIISVLNSFLFQKLMAPIGYHVWDAVVKKTI